MKTDEKGAANLDNKKQIRRRILIFTVSVLFLFSLFAVDLFRIQIVNAADYSTQRVALSETKSTIAASRGEILDCNGTPLVTNEQINSVVLNASYFPSTKEQDKRNEIILSLINLLESEGAAWNDNLPLVLNSDGSVSFKENADKDITYLKSKDVLYLNSYATAQNCFDELVEKFSLGDYSAADALKIASVCYSLKKISFSAANPFTVADYVSPTLAAKIKENSSFYRGVDINVTTARHYTDGTIAPHIIGITGKLNESEYKDRTDAYKAESADQNLTTEQKTTLSLRAYAMDDTIGKFGLESAMEDYLRGTNGIMTTTTASDGTKTSEITREPVDGDTVILTLDSVLQKKVQDSLAAFVERYRDKDAIPAVGSAVVMDVNTGAVLACATYPSYDLNTYYQNYEALSKDKSSPLWNRALMSTYEPGSTMKPAIAAAGLEEGVITETSKFYCSHIYRQFTDTTFKCLGSHGWIDVKNALNQSCNIYFYETGRLLGINRMNDYCTRFGLGQKTGVEINESSGVLAGIAYREAHGGTWYPGDTVQAAIGQSDNLFTPIQLCSYVSTIANGGTRYRAHFVKSVKSSDYSETLLSNDGVVLNETGVSQNSIRIVKEGMGMLGARLPAFKSLPVKVAAKTGTAESKAKVSGKIVTGLNGFMISFAPADDPQIAVCVAIENLNSGSATASLVAEIYKAYFETDGGSVNTAQGYGSLLG